MTKSRSLPEFVLRLGTYRELAMYAQAFAEGHLNLLMIFGDAGIGKSRHVRDAVGEDACWIDGNASPFGIYMKAYEYLNEPMVLDDVDGLYRDRQGVRLLKTLCQSEVRKTLSWQTDAGALDRRRIPREFKTTSRVVIIANQWKSLNADVAALEDRGHVIHFAPSALEVHIQASRWFWDQDIFDFVAEHLHLMGRHSLRTYVLAYELKKADMEWKWLILGRCLTGTAFEVAKLKADGRYQKEEDRAAAFEKGGHGCRSTYFYHAKKLRARSDVPIIKLSRTGPREPGPLLDIMDLIRQRSGYLGRG